MILEPWSSNRMRRKALNGLVLRSLAGHAMDRSADAQIGDLKHADQAASLGLKTFVFIIPRGRSMVKACKGERGMRNLYHWWNWIRSEGVL